MSSNFVKAGHWYVNLDQVSAVEAIVRQRTIYSGTTVGEQKEQLEIRVFLAGSEKPVELHEDEAETFMNAFSTMVETA